MKKHLVFIQRFVKERERMGLIVNGLKLQRLEMICVAWLVIGMAKAAVAQTTVKRAGCLGECGGVSIPYPFGIVGPGLDDCYVPGFNVSCEDGVPRLLGVANSNNFILSEIQVSDHLFRLQNNNSTAVDCINSTTQNNHRTSSVNISLGGRFKISGRWNKFKVFGCNAAATITDGSSLVGRCDVPGQCNIALPDRFNSFSYNVTNKMKYSNSTCSTACSVAVLVEASFDVDVNILTNNSYSQPLMAEWEIQDGLCNTNTGFSPICGEDAFCSYTSTGGSGYRCLCLYGGKGNPYLDGTAGCNRGGLRKRSKMIISLTIVGAILLLGMFIFYLWRRMVRRKGAPKVKESLDAVVFGENEEKDFEVPFIEFETILSSTDNFSDRNKLGQGGFGPVYKAKLPGGQEVAVKKLSTSSEQGLEEFKNEVILIVKLQHRNLVKLLGYSIHEDERILLYEYMPNKSLDCLLFDSNQRKLLNWDKRYNIILGIARGLVYLHEDSRLRIIHRDLKTSNILLDGEMQPKISDFGMARIFRGNQIQENTNRVVGTYGYMAPEYASHGIFSMKSDVFSFGVILLEMISGRKNSLFYDLEKSFTLLGYAWELWGEGKWVDLIDRNIIEECDDLSQVEKCIHVALLCVQENTAYRPSMVSVLAMFVSSGSTLPTPKQPAFIFTSQRDSSIFSRSSVNDVTISILECR